MAIASLYLLLLLGVRTAYPTPTPVPAPAPSSQCRSSPNSSSWPTPSQWSAFNTTLGGALIKTIPLAAPCHTTYDGVSSFDPTTCEHLRNVWDTDIGLRANDPTALYNPAWESNSCLLPPQPSNASDTCTLGPLPAYTVAVSSTSQISPALAFAKSHNLRLTIRSTGHDWNGKSSGASSLSLWMHQLDAVSLAAAPTTICGRAYPHVLSAGAGAQIGDVYKLARQAGRVVVAGAGLTVGFAGGYVQGGGHSPLSGRFGMAADQVLAFEAVTARGEQVTATPCNEHSELFYALAGGGAGTFAVVTGVTVKTHPDLPTSGARLSFSVPVGTPELEKYWSAAESFYKHAKGWAENGIHAYVEQLLQFGIFAVKPWVAYGLPLEELRGALAPFLAELDALGVRYDISYLEEQSFLDAFGKLYDAMVPVPAFITGSRLVPASVDAAEAAAAIRELNARGVYVGTTIFTPNRTGLEWENGVNPAFEHMLMHVNGQLGVQDVTKRAEAVAFMTGAVEETLVKIAPNSGAYLNEANPGERNWQQSFHGEKYARLLEAKRKYDPEGVFYALHAVGTEGWEEDESGVLCKIT